MHSDNKSNLNLNVSYTQRAGVRPFGLSTLIAGFDLESKPKLYVTEPSGAFASWKASAIGKNSAKINEMLENSFEDGLSYEKALSLVIDCMIQYVESGAKNIEVGVMFPNEQMRLVEDEVIDRIIQEIEERKKKEGSK